jgi:hypothetical protein
MTDLNALKARLGSLSFNARTKLASHSPSVFKLVTVDMPALILELEEMRVEAKEFYCGAEPPARDET